MMSIPVWPGRSLSRGVSVQGGLCQGDPPAHSKQQAVRILLECILVYLKYCMAHNMTIFFLIQNIPWSTIPFMTEFLFKMYLNDIIYDHFLFKIFHGS